MLDVFNPDGSMVKRYISNGQLNAPWGIAKARQASGAKSSENTNVFLVGNFGDGHINAYTDNGNFLGQLRQHGQP